MNMPGFVDLQVNGYLGVDFSAPELTAEAFSRAADALLAAGTAAFLPTVITRPLDTYRRNLERMAAAMEAPGYRGRLLGFHLEGPFISPEPGAVGAHNPAWVRAPDIDTLERLQAWAKGKIRLLTVAAERPGAPELIAHAVKTGITVALGHQLAGADDLARAADAGATALTHLGNGLPHLLNRHDNPIWDGLAEDRLTAMLITDGHHLPPRVLQSMIRAKQPSRVVVTSDASPIAGLPPGRYETLGNVAVLTETGRLYNPDTGYLVGSGSIMLQCMNTLAAQNRCDLPTLLRLGVDQPLALLGLSATDLAPGERLAWDGERFSVVDRKQAHASCSPPRSVHQGP